MQDLNLRPIPYHGIALPTTLKRHMVGADGVAPPESKDSRVTVGSATIYGISSRYSLTLIYKPQWQIPSAWSLNSLHIHFVSGVCSTRQGQ